MITPGEMSENDGPPPRKPSLVRPFVPTGRQGAEERTRSEAEKPVLRPFRAGGGSAAAVGDAIAAGRTDDTRDALAWEPIAAEEAIGSGDEPQGDIDSAPHVTPDAAAEAVGDAAAVSSEAVAGGEEPSSAVIEALADSVKFVDFAEVSGDSAAWEIPDETSPQPLDAVDAVDAVEPADIGAERVASTEELVIAETLESIAAAVRMGRVQELLAANPRDTLTAFIAGYVSASVSPEG